MNHLEAEKLLEQAETKAKMLKDIGMDTQADLVLSETKKKIEAGLPPEERPSTNTKKWLSMLLTSDARMISIKKKIERLVREKDGVMIIGESGTGKELLAHALHGERAGNFVSINCAGMPEHLIESELFGHVKGAFTGADFETTGLFEAANDGTLFLDEIGELPFNLQAKLLRVLQEQKIRKVGSVFPREIRVRVVSATHVNIPEEISRGKFRLDLYARLATIELVTIPLRFRRGDIKDIVNSLDKSKSVYDSLANMTVKLRSADMIETSLPFLDQDFPLNVRDLQRYVRRFELFGEI